MSHSLISATDLTRAQLFELLGRAESLRSSTSSLLIGKRVALALSDKASPLPGNPGEVLRRAGCLVDLVPREEPKLSPTDLAARLKKMNADVVLVSQPSTDSAAMIAEQLQTPYLNAGDGANENPVAALFYLCAIWFLTHDLKTRRIALLGNLKFDPTAHSLAILLRLLDVRISFVSPAALSMPYDISDQVRAAGTEVEETNDLGTTIRKTDVLFLAPIEPTGIPAKIYDKFKDFYRVDSAALEGANGNLIVLGNWQGAEEILSPTRDVVHEASDAMMQALIEFAVS